jgi:hypothetical protein
VVVMVVVVVGLFMMTLGITQCIGSIAVVIAPIRQAWYTVKKAAMQF